MRLRNKKTGEIIRFYDGITLNGEEYDSLAELNEDWEDLDAIIVRTKNRIEFLERKLKFEKHYSPN